MDSLLCLYKCEKGGAERLRIHEMGIWIGIGMGVREFFARRPRTLPLYQRCSTRSLISWVRPWFQNWVPI